MQFRASSRTTAIAAVALAGLVIVPASSTFAAPAPEAVLTEAIVAPITAPQPVTPALSNSAPLTVRPMAPIPDEVPTPRSDADETAEIDSELECLAKVVLHEAGNQGRRGMAAVAHVVMNRVNSGRFASTICGTVLQRGQFFNVHAYHPQGRDHRWPQAVAIAREVRAGDSQDVTNGAFFFRANYARRGFPGRTRVASIGAHHFYR